MRLNDTSNIWYETEDKLFTLRWDNDSVELTPEDVKTLIPILEKFLRDIF